LHTWKAGPRKRAFASRVVSVSTHQELGLAQILAALPDSLNRPQNDLDVGLAGVNGVSGTHDQQSTEKEANYD